MLKGFTQPAPSSRIKVAIALRTASPDEACLDRLRDKGLKIDRVVGNTLFGTLQASDRKALAADPDVLEVEESAKLRLS